jgi:regulator of sigma E protease
MLAVLIGTIGILITILFVVGTHEAAHFITARALGVKVLRFSIGFGKTLWQRRDKSGTEYIFALIPLGGYVMMLNEGEGEIAKEDLPFAYNRQPFYKKFLIVMAGPFANILCAICLYWLIFMFGFVTLKPVIGRITPHSIAAAAKVQSQQEIISIDHSPTQTWPMVLFRVLMHAGSQDILRIETKSLANEKTQSYLLDLSHWRMDDLTPDPLTSLGIAPYEPPLGPLKIPKNMIRKIQYPPLTALSHATLEVWHFTYFNFVIIGKLLTGKLSLQTLGGPITIFQTAGEALNYGLIAFAAFLAFLSLSIGIINLLPIPGLDGGHLFMQMIEWMIRRPIPDVVLLTLYRGGVILIVFLIAQAIINDLLRLL